MCGNGWLDPGEECDDGVNDGGYGKCAKGCVFGPRCGDGHKDDNEGCDDGNNVDGDGCSADCGVVIK
jgi:cysteine-rich repeat protein